MPTSVRMYDCAFGDCFRITHDLAGAGNVPRQRHLYVDFGIHQTRCQNINGWKQARYDAIIADMPPHADFLLTHYHYDHYAGVIHMIQNSTYRFDDVYIPDVWNMADSVTVVKLLLMRNLFTNSVLENGLSLVSFLLAICHANGRIHFVKRGKTIQDRYVALWPTEAKVQAAAAKVLTYANRREAVPQGLDAMAEELCDVVRAMSEMEGYEMRGDAISRLEDIERRLREMGQNIRPDDNLKNKLSYFEHRINVIFQNQPGTDRNILFTGDADNGVRLWNFVRNNRDGQVPFYEHYHVIKVPHHGTKNHYCSFAALSSDQTTYLIPNGLIADWPIAEEYSRDANARGCAVCCSQNTACLAADPGCHCTNCTVITNAPQIYLDI